MYMKSVKTRCGMVFALGEVVAAPPGATYRLGVLVELDGRQVGFALEDMEVVTHKFAVGDPLMVKFHSEGEYAEVVTMKSVAEAFGYTVTGDAGRPR